MKLELTDDMRAEMRRRAEAATPGPWRAEYCSVFPAQGPFARDGIHTGIAHLHDGEYIENLNGDADAAHIAGLDPQTVLALLDERDRLERERDEARKALADEIAGRDPCPFARPKYELPNETPCPVCGDLGYSTGEPSRCVSLPGKMR